MAAKLNDLLADIVRERAVVLARYDASVRKKVFTLLRNVERQLVRRITDLDFTGDLTTARREMMEATINWARTTIRTEFAKIDRTVTAELRDLARIEAKFIEREFTGALKVQILDVGLSPAGLASVVSDVLIRGNPAEEWWAGQSSALARRFAQEMRLGITSGETLSQLIQRVRGTQDMGFKDGIMNSTRRDAAALVRTAVQSTMNDTRLAMYKANGDLIKAVQHVSTLDDRTTDICAVRDGLQWTLDGEPIDHDLPFERPPLHWNCRSTMTPVMKTWQEMGFDADELSAGQRASMDGTVPADMTYEQWLKSKPVEFQDRVLGEGRAELWRGGHITFRELVDQRGRPLTLQQIEENF